MADQISNNTSENNKRIARNTAMLYIRMLISILISLYTSRITLQVLGVTDYGIYNVVGGVVAMFTFINGTLSTATQRFITYDLGLGDSEKLSKTFSMVFWSHGVLSMILLLLTEIVGIWMLNTEINIPSERLSSAFWVFQLSCLSMVLTVTQVPYISCIVAHEKMGIYAYFSILDILLRLLLIIILQFVDFDKLILYAILTTSVTAIILCIERFYCLLTFQECHIKMLWDWGRFKEMFSFFGWNLSAQLVYMLRTQGVNILVNMFYGPAMNAARGIAVTVQGTITGFIGNFMMAINPQVVKYYAKQEMESMYVLIRRACKYSTFLMLLLSIPLIIEIDWVLKLWLENPPEYAAEFCRLMLISSIVDTMSSPIFFGTLASGKIKKYQIVMSIILGMVPLFTYIMFKLGVPAYYCLYSDIAMFGVGIFGRAILTNKVTGFPVIPYIKKSLLPIFGVILLSLPIPIFIYLNMEDTWERLLAVILSSEICLIVVICLIGMTKSEKEVLLTTALRKLKIKK